MRLACLQFAPRLGEVERNISRATDILDAANIDHVDWIVLPELAFSGYNFDSAEHIRPYLEATSGGPSAAWAKAKAAQYQCLVTVGYPERSSETFEEIKSHEPKSEATEVIASIAESLATDVAAHTIDELEEVLKKSSAVPESRPSSDGYKWFNSTVTVNPAGEVVHHYRKTFLYYTDATWAQPGEAFGEGSLKISSITNDGASSEVKFAHGICMDMNPRAFTADWEDYEFGRHLITSKAELAILSMAWLSRDLSPIELMGDSGRLPDVQTIAYWINRLEPLQEQDKDVIVVCANRCGVEGAATYAGSSTIMRLGKHCSSLWAFLGKGEEAVLLVDTERDLPMYQMVSRAQDPISTGKDPEGCEVDDKTSHGEAGNNEENGVA